MVINQDEADKKKQKDDEAKAAAKRKQIQQIQLAQIQGNDPSLNMPVSEAGSNFGGPISSVGSMRRKVAHFGSHMSVEELRMNKGILREISKKKKADIGSQDAMSR